MYIILCFIVSPNIVVPVEGQEFTITEGSNGSITCTATGYPPPTVVWLSIDSNDRLMSGDPIMVPTGVGNVTNVSVELMVTGAMRVDTGMYTCSASNIVSSTTRNITISVQCKLNDYLFYVYTPTQCSISLQMYNMSSKQLKTRKLVQSQPHTNCNKGNSICFLIMSSMTEKVLRNPRGGTV